MTMAESKWQPKQRRQTDNPGSTSVLSLEGSSTKVPREGLGDLG